MPVEFALRVLNPLDPFVRIFGIWIDSPPPEGWTVDLAGQNTAAFKRWIKDGDSVNGTLDLSDGKHKLYVAISQTASANLGSWAIEGTFDGVKLPTLSKVDWDTIGRYDVSVKNGKIVSQMQHENEELSELRDITGLNTLSRVKDVIVGKATEIKDIVDNNRKESIIISAASAGVAITAAYLSTRRGKRF